MSLKALLLSKDPDTVQTLSDALGDADIAVEHCTEPFSAAKRLMAERFAAIVVDCDDEQGASWVLQSARMAANNKNAVTIAVLRGEPGVRSASKLGENFVLYKPVLPKQAENTIRIARNLMKGDSSGATPAPSVSATGAPSGLPSLGIAAAPAREPMAPPSGSQVAPAAGLPVIHEAQPNSFESSQTEASAGLIRELADKPLDEVVPLAAGPTAAAAEPASKAKKSEISFSEPDIERVLSNLGPAKPQTLAEAQVNVARKEAVKQSSVPVEAPATQPLAESTKWPHLPEPPASFRPASPLDVDDIRQRLPVATHAGAHRKGISLGLIFVVLLVAVIATTWWRVHRSSDEGPVEQTQPVTEAPAQPAPSSQPAAAEPAATPSKPEAGQVRTEKLVPQPEVVVRDLTQQQESAPKESEDATQPEEPAPAAIAVPHQAPPAKKAVLKKAAEPEPPALAAVNAAHSNGFENVVGSVPVAMPTVATPNRVTVSQGVSRGLLLHDVKPTYPRLAKEAAVQGTVLLRAVIGRDGMVRDLKVLSGHPMLAQAAVNAVKQWRYRPYLLNGNAVEVETDIKIDFKL